MKATWFLKLADQLASPRIKVSKNHIAKKGRRRRKISYAGRDTKLHFLPQLSSDAATEHATGDFVRIGIEVGAELGNMSHAWWDQVAVEHAVTVPSTLRDIYNPYGDSMIIVNKHGRRVVNEKAVYNEQIGRAHV